MSEKIEVENVGQPGKTYKVDAAKYAEMRKAVLTVTPSEPPGLTPALRTPLPRRRDRRLVGQMRAT